MRLKEKVCAGLVIAGMVFLAVIARAESANDGLKQILGSDPATWTISGSGSVIMEAGQPILTTPANGYAFLNGKTVYRAPMEYRFTFRLHPKKPYGSSVTVSVGCAELQDKSKQAFTASLSAAPDSGYINLGCSIQPETAKPINSPLYLKAVTERSLAWPEDMRRTIEAQMSAAPKVEQMLHRMRLVVTPEKYTAWIDGRFVGQFDVKEALDASGTINITMYYGAELVSVSASPYKPVNNRFFPLELGGFINSSALIDGKPLVRNPLGAPDRDIEFKGIPFRFPAPDEKKNDHLDLGPSWTRFGSISGYIAANFGTFGGRWISADRIDPSRFCMYVPYAQYKALHLIAVYDGEKDNVPIITAQFYRPNAGHPMNFSGRVPAFTASSGGVHSIPVVLSNGKKGKLFHVVIPIDPDKMTWFSDLKRVGLELTKEVKPYRGYPDPLEYSWHGAGLPSGVHIYAATLEVAGVEADIQPDALAHVWTAPSMPSYTINVRNNTGSPTEAILKVSATDYDGKDTEVQQHKVSLPPGNGIVPVKISLHPNRYGLHYLNVSCKAGNETFTYTRNFAYLHPDTRERGNWAEGKGPIFGYWNWSGGHDTPDFKTELIVMAQAGAETNLSAYLRASPEIRALAEKLGYTSRAAFEHGVIYVNSFSFANAKNYDPNNPEATQKWLIEELKKSKVEKGPLNVPEYIPFFPEPGLGPITYGIWPTHYNEPDYQFTKEEEEYFQSRLQMFLIGARAVRKEWPDVKILLPYGDPHYTALFLRKSAEARELIDGVALDLPNFERLPEQQINQVVLNRLYPILQDIKKYKPNPYLIVVEGTCVSSKDYDTTPEDQANICTRNFLVLIGYGINNHESSNAPFDCANYWGENHYGGGYCTRLPLAMPKLAYVSYATLTRHVNRCNFIRYVPTGSTSVYCQEYKHYKTGRLVYVLWTIRGTRPVTVQVNPGQTVEVYDVNDNPIVLKENGGKVTFNINQSPVYLEGMTREAVITLGEPDHSDAQPAKVSLKLANLADRVWTIKAERDQQYEQTNRFQIERFLADMTAQPVIAPKPQGGKALAIHLGQQKIDRRVMPYYTTIVPEKPVTIPGKSSHLGLWVKASSDWGRVVFSLRDAKGERWLSVGTKDDWNSDDMRCWSAFCFDGWRYIRFESPASAPYDCYRELGTSNWGSYGGDGIVDLPLKLEKIIVERRGSVIYGNDLVPASPDDVLLGDLYAEYTCPEDKTSEAVRLSRLRMPVTGGAPEIENPIAEMDKTGAGAPTQVLKVADPEHMYDGTRCHVFFKTVEGAQKYDIWVSPYADGRGAIKLASGITESGKLIEGLRPDTDFYVFVVYTDKDGKLSKPSQPLKINLKNRFVYK